jgi:hypothetical protein
VVHYNGATGGVTAMIQSNGPQFQILDFVRADDCEDDICLPKTPTHDDAHYLERCFHNIIVGLAACQERYIDGNDEHRKEPPRRSSNNDESLKKTSKIYDLDLEISVGAKSTRLSSS